MANLIWDSKNKKWTENTQLNSMLAQERKMKQAAAPIKQSVLTPEQQQAQVDRQRSARQAYGYRQQAGIIQRDYADAKNSANSYLASLPGLDYSAARNKGKNLNPLRKNKDLESYFDAESMDALDALYGSGYKDADRIRDYLTQKAQNDYDAYRHRLDKVQKAKTDADNALYTAQQTANSVGYGGNTQQMPDLQKLKANADAAYANLRKVQAEHPSGNIAEYGVEQALATTSQGVRDFLSAVYTNLGSYNEAAGNVLSGKEPSGYNEWMMKAAIGDADINELQERMISLQEKEKNEGLSFDEKVRLNLLQDALSGGQLTKNRVNDLAAQGQKEQQEIESVYANIPEEQRGPVRNVSQALGSAGTMVGLSAVNPIIGMEYLYGSAGGGAAADAIAQGASLQQANVASAATGAANVVIEQMFAGLPGVGGAIKAGDKAAGKISNPYIQAGVKRLVDAFGEGMEEIASQALQPFINRATYDPDSPLPTFDELAQAFGGGFAASVFLGLPVDVAAANAQTAGIKQIGQQYNTPESIQGLVQSGLESDPKSKAYKAAQSVQQQINNGKAPSDYQVGQLAIQNQAQIELEEKTARLDAFKSGQADFLSFSDDERTYYVDPRNYKDINKTFGTNFTGKETPLQIRQTLDAMNSQVTTLRKQAELVYNTATDKQATLNGILKDISEDNGERAGIHSPLKNSQNPLPSAAGPSSMSRPDSVNINRDLSIKNTPSNDIINQNEQNSNAISIGDWVYNTAGDNIGQVLEKRGDSYLVTFRNPETGYEDSAVISKDNLRKMADTYIPSEGEAIPDEEGSFIMENQPDNEIPMPVPEMQEPPLDMMDIEYSDREPALPEDATPEEVINFTRNKVLTEMPREAKPKPAEAIFAAWDAFQRKLVDSAYTIDRLGKISGDKELYNVLNNARQSRQAGEFMLGLSITGQETYQANFKGENVGKSLNDIWAPIKAKGKQYYGEFLDYLLNVHNIDRMSVLKEAQDRLNKFRQKNHSILGISEEDVVRLSKGDTDEAVVYREYLDLMAGVLKAQDKPVFGYDVTAEQSKGAAQLYESLHPEFKDLAAKVYKYNDNLLTYRVDTGLLSKEAAALFRKMYPHYVPVFRNNSALETTNEIKNEDLSEAGKLFAPIDENKVKVAQTVKRAKGGDTPILPIDQSMTQQTLQVVQNAKKNQLGQRMLNIGRSGKAGAYKYIKSVYAVKNVQYDMENPIDTMKRQQTREGNVNTFVVFEDGKAWAMDVNDGIFEGLKALTDPPKGPKKIIKANDMYKRLITGYNPIFIPRNFLKDLQDAGLYTKHPDIFVKNFGKAWKEMTTNGALWQQYQALGGFNSSFFDYNKNLDSEHSALQRWTIDKVETANMMIEQAPRFAEFLSTLEKGGDSYENLMRAMYNAADITVNFGRSGTWGKIANSTFVPFFNPSVQGFDKLIRRFKETKGVKGWTSLVIRAAVIGVLPSLINAMLYDDDDEYQIIDDRTKDTYYLFKMGDGVWAKIPKGRVLSLFGSTAQRLLRAAKGENGAFAGFYDSMRSQVSPTNPFTSNILSAIWDAANNKTWYGGHIENASDENKRPEDRYDHSTSSLAVWLGSVLKVSPKKIHYLLDAYTGVIGDFALPLTTPKAEQNPFTKAFTTDVVYSNRISDDFYNAKQELTYQENEEPASDVPSVTDLTLRYYNKQAGSVSELYKKIGEIENSSLPDKEKRQQVRELRALINGIQQTALQAAPGLQKALEKNYGQEVDLMATEAVQTRQAEIAYTKANKEVFGSEYALKTVGGATYDNAKEVNGKGTSYDSYYEYYINTRTTNGEAMKEKDKARVLIDLDVSEKDIENIYANAFEDKNTQKEKSISYAVKLGADASTFAAYKTQDFSGEGGTERARQWILDNSSTQEEVAALYQIKLEDKNTKKENSIQYAKSVGVRPEAFVERLIQVAQAEGDKEGSAEVYLVNGQAVNRYGETTVDGTKKRDAMTSLLSSDYTPEERMYFYQKEYPADDKYVWAMVAGIPVDQYIQLKRDEWDIHGRKDSSGKTISGSKKAAYVAYVKKLKLNAAQRAMLLLQSGYSLDTKNYKDIVQYIASLKMSIKDKLRLADAIGLATSGNKILYRKKK